MIPTCEPSITLEDRQAVDEALRLGRRFVGWELKRQYWETAARNLRRVGEERATQGRLDL